MKQLQVKTITMKLNMRKLCFDFAIVLLGIGFLLFSFFNETDFLTIVRTTSVAMLMITILLRGKMEKSMVILLIVACYIVLTSANTSLNIFYAIVISIAMCALNDDHIFKIMHNVNLLILATVVISLLAGVVENRTWTHLGRTRSSLGFAHPNFPGLFSFSLVSVYFVKSGTINLKKGLIALAFSIIVFFMTDSRTGFYATLLMFAIYPIIKGIPRKILKYITIILIALLFISPCLWVMPWMNSDKVNTLLSLRPEIFRNYIFAQTEANFLLGGSKTVEIDNFYLLLLFNCGIFFYAFLAVVSIQSACQFVEQKRHMELTFILVILIVALFESSILRPELLFVPLYWKFALERILKKTGKRSVMNHKNECRSD